MAASDYMPISYPDFGSQYAVNEWTGRNRWNAVYTITLGELIDKGIFDWSLDVLDWSSAAYSTEQYTRVCAYFIERFRFREISIEPFYEWATMLHRKLVYELMPKFKLMYQFLDDSFDIAQIESYIAHDSANGSSTANSTTNENTDDYKKRRAIGSDYPETLLSGNADYISNGQDEESENIGERTGTESNNASNESSEQHDYTKRGDLFESYQRYQEEFTAIDNRLLDELESMFIGLYTASIDGM